MNVYYFKPDKTMQPGSSGVAVASDLPVNTIQVIVYKRGTQSVWIKGINKWNQCTKLPAWVEAYLLLLE